ncbi:MAG: roadblock/LC7 domain-containing protein, partial [Actinobacteria bacterium]|nr:roadblock/LC7 domain-containing protein [Actinomycetota bacterium]
MSDLHAGSRSERLDRAIHGLLAQTPEIEAAAVVSFDGLPMASALPPSMDEDRVAAMSAALLSLGERAAQGLGRGELSQVYIEGETGTVFLVSADNEAVLVAVAAQGAKVGMMLYEVRRAAAA